MKMKPALAAVAMLASALSVGTVAPSHAAGCYYKAVNLEGRVLDIRGVGHAAKQSWACNRARRECNRRLDRAYRKGKLPRGVICKKSG